MQQEDGGRYLIITHDNFYNAIQPLAAWKQKTGMTAKVIKLSEIGADSISIRNYIKNAYDHWPIRPEYLLLVGAPNFVPFPMVATHFDPIYSDNYYTNTQGDIYNEILSGRLTVHDTLEAQTVVNKILLYERNPFLQDSFWFKKACLIARREYDPDDSIYFSDLYYAADLMTRSGFVKIDTFSDDAGDNKDSVINAVNEGRSIVMFRGSAVNNWPSPFDVNPDLLSNGAKLPVVLSITCITLGTGPTPAYAEKWFLTGTPTTPRGAAGYFATTTAINGQAYLRSAVAKGFHEALFLQSKTTFGQACEGGRIKVYTSYPFHGGDLEYLGFTTVGDPAMDLWTDTPRPLVCIYPDTISLGAVGCTVNVGQAGNPTPVRDADVCVMGKRDSTVYAVDTTDLLGNAIFGIQPHFGGDTIWVTVTGRNLKPHEGFMITHAVGPYIAYLKSSIQDTTGGNGDGYVNPGETITLPAWVRNYGVGTGIGVSARLFTADSFTAVTDSVKSFGDIPASDSAFTGSDGYDFTVTGSCPDGHRIVFQLECRDTNDSVWLSHIDVLVRAAQITFEGFTVSAGNGNSTFEPGESVTVAVTVRNQGSAGLDSVSAQLVSLNPQVGVIDSLGFFNRVGPESAASNIADPFAVYSDPGFPPGTYADFRLALCAGYYADTIDFSIVVGTKDYYVWNPDPTPGSGLNIHALLMNLGYNGDYGVSLPQDLSPYQSVFVCLGVFPHNRVIAADQPEAGLLAGRGGCLYLEGGDVWYFDPLGTGYDFSGLFGIRATDDGSADLGPVAGRPVTFTEGMLFSYNGENNYMDHIENASAASFIIFNDADNNYGCAVANNGNGYRTVGVSFELGLLADSIAPSTRAILLDSIIHFFKATTGISEQLTISRGRAAGVLIYPNPFRRHAEIHFTGVANEKIVWLKIYDLSGRCVRTLVDKLLPTQEHRMFYWDGKDNQGRRVPSGVYFVTTKTRESEYIEKAILLK